MVDMNILCDLDGVLSDLVTQSLLTLKIESFDYPKGEHDICKALQLDPKYFWGLLIDDEKFWSEMPWMMDGKQIFDLIINHFDLARKPKGHKICILSSPTMCHYSLAGKSRWIQSNLPVWMHRRFLIGPAKEMCAHKDSLLIDDSENNCEEFIKAGGQAIMVNRWWNKGHEFHHRAAEALKEDLEIRFPQ